MKNAIKTLALISLIGLSLFQLTRLWFDDLSNSNLFYNASNLEPAVRQEYMIKPDVAAIYSLGRSGYSLISRTNKEFDNLFNLSMSLMKAALSDGQLIETVAPDFRWQEQNILLKYDFDIEPNVLLEDLDVKNLAFSEKAKSINEIVIIPGAESSTKVSVYFVDEGDESIMGYVVNSELVGDLKTRFGKLEDKEFPHYQSTKELKQSQFIGNILLPDVSILESNTITLAKPFYKNGQLNKDDLENYIKLFFVYNEFTLGGFEDENTTKLTYIDPENDVHVNYHKSGFIEYTSGESINKKNMTVSEAFYVANQFIEKRDAHIKNMEYSLAGYEQKDNGINFYYKYNYKGMPILLGEDILGELQMKHPIEITVEDGSVIVYKRYLLSMESYSEVEAYDIAYNNAINNMLRKKYPDGKYPSEKYIKDMTLGYSVDKASTSTSLGNAIDAKQEVSLSFKLRWLIITHDDKLYQEPIVRDE